MAASTAMAADNTVLAEVRSGTGSDESMAYKLDYESAIYAYMPNYSQFFGIELVSKQSVEDAATSTKLVGRLGMGLPNIGGFRTVVNAQLGQSFEATQLVKVGKLTKVIGGNYNIYGAEVNFAHDIFSITGLSGKAGYRFRDGFEKTGVDNQEFRGKLGVAYNFNDNTVIDVLYYRYTNKFDVITDDAVSDQMAVGFTRSF